MKRFQFSLERVLRLKQQRERLAELRLMQAQQVLEKHRADMARLGEQIRQTADAVGGKMGGTLPVGAWIAYYQHSTQLEHLLRAAETRRDAAQRAVEEAAAARTEITKQVEALLYLRHHHWEAHLDEREAEEQVRLDEVGMRRWREARLAGANNAQSGEVP